MKKKSFESLSPTSQSPLKQQSKIITGYSRQNIQSRWNPDEVFRKKNAYDIYYEMVRGDYQVKSVLEMKKSAIIGSGWKIEPGKNTEGDKYLESIKDFVELNFCELFSGAFDEAIYSILTAIEFGFSVSEILYRRNDSGQIILDKLKQIPPDTIEFDMNEFGDLKQDGLLQYQDSGMVSLDMNKFVIFVWNMKDGNWYGNSDLRSAYVAYFSKTQITKFWNIYLEKYGMPFILGRYNPAVDRSDTDSLNAIITNIQASSGALIPDDVKIEFIEVSQRGASAFEAAITRYDNMITRSLLMPETMGFSDRDSGSYALAEKQYEFFNVMINRFRRQIEQVIDEQIIKRLVNLNFSNVKTYPHFKFEPGQKSEDKDRIMAFIDLIRTGTVQPIESDIMHIREKLGFPSGEVIINQKKPEIQTEIQTEKRQFSQEKKLKFAEKFLNLKKINDGWRESVDTAVGRLSKIIDQSKTELINSIEEKKIIDKEKLERVETLTQLPMLGNIKTQFERLFNSVANQGIDDSEEEIQKQIKQKDFAIIDKPELRLSAAKQFIKSFAKTKAFAATKDLNDQIMKEVRQVVIDGIQAGESSREMRSDLEELFEPYTIGAKVPGGRVEPHKLNTIVRTNASTFYNEGRIAAVKEAMREKLVTFMQFSAILDDSTTEICSSTDGTVFPATEISTLRTLTPPLHFNCRSILIPISRAFEDEIKSGIDSGALKNGPQKPNSFYDGF